jgi:aminoglycoside phosphotransferase (APT) family kinase protein
MQDLKSLPPEPNMNACSVTVGEGERAETFMMRCKNIVEALEQLVSDLRFKGHIDYLPRKHYTDESRRVWVHGEMSSRNWFWRMQVCTLYRHCEHPNLLTTWLVPD